VSGVDCASTRGVLLAASVIVSGDVSARDVASAQKLVLEAAAGPKASQVVFVPADLELGFDVELVFNAVSTLTGVAAFVHTLVSARRGRRTAADAEKLRRSTKGAVASIAGDSGAAAEVAITVDEADSKWTLKLGYPRGPGHVVRVRQTAPEEFEVDVRQVRGD
jgi:hypothetical protein